MRWCYNVQTYHNVNCKNSVSDRPMQWPTWTNLFLASPWAASVSLMVEESLATKASTSSWATSYFSLEVDILAFVSFHFTISSSWRTNYQFLVSSRPRKGNCLKSHHIYHGFQSSFQIIMTWDGGGRKWVQCSRIKAKLGVVFSCWLTVYIITNSVVVQIVCTYVHFLQTTHITLLRSIRIELRGQLLYHCITLTVNTVQNRQDSKNT